MQVSVQPEAGIKELCRVYPGEPGAGWRCALPPAAKGWLGLLPPCPAVGHLLGPKQGTDIWAAGRGYSRTQFIFAKLLITV